jgi:hypothetical protein
VGLSEYAKVHTGPAMDVATCKPCPYNCHNPTVECTVVQGGTIAEAGKKLTESFSFVAKKLKGGLGTGISALGATSFIDKEAKEKVALNGCKSVSAVYQLYA